MSDVKKVVLAYSGGLDTSVILKWLQDTYQCEVVTFTADLGQGEELEPARQKALKFGIKPENIFIDDLREEFVRDFVFPMFRANTIYEGEYLLGTSIARPLIAKRLIEIARQTVRNAERTYDINVEKYRSGTLTGMELKNQQTQLTDAKNSLTDAIISYKLKLLDLKIQTLWDYQNNRSYLPVDLLK